MNMMYGHGDARQSVTELAQFIATDKHGTVLRNVQRMLVDQGIIASMPFDKDRPPPFPGANDVFATQASFFDNWPGGKVRKSMPYRYAVTVEVWAKPERSINFGKRDFTAKGDATMFTATELPEKAAKLTSSKLRHPITDDYATLLIDLATSPNASNCLFGPLLIRGGTNGTHYYDHAVVILTLSPNGQPSQASLYSQGQVLDLATWRTTYPNGKPLRGNVTYQSRTSDTPQLAMWSTK